MATTITYKGSDLTSFSNTSKTLRTAGKYLEGDITITAGIDVNNQNKTVIPTEAIQSITADTGYTGLGTVTVNGITNTYVGSSVPVQSAITITPSSATQTITGQKYMTGDITVAAITTTSQAIPQVSINPETGLITATANQTEGYVEADTKRGTLQLTTKATTTYAPSTSDQYIQAGTYLTGLVTIEGMTNGDNLAYGTTTTVSEALVTKSLLDALATTIKNKATSSTLPMTISAMQTAVQSIRTSSQISLQSKTVSPNGSTVVITPDSGYDGLASVQVNAVNATELNVSSNGTYTPASGQYYNRVVVATDSQAEFNLQTKQVTPTTSPQSVTPDEGYNGLSSVTVQGIPSNYADVTHVTAEVGDVVAGETFVDSTGTAKTGTLAVNSYYVLSEIPAASFGNDGDLVLKI